MKRAEALYGVAAILAAGSGIRSIVKLSAEGGFMPRRIEVVVRNPGFEGTENALGAYTLDFDDEMAYKAALSALEGELTRYGSASLRHSLVLQNEKGEHMGFNPQYYVSHRAGDVQDLAPPKWSLPEHGAEPPERES